MTRSAWFYTLSGLIALLLGIGFVANHKSVCASFSAAGSWEEFVAATHAKMPEKCENKSKWIDFNGLLIRLMGRRLSNLTLKYRGGLLEDPTHRKTKVDGIAFQLEQWDSLLKSWGGRYMLVLMPCKLDRALEMLPPGCNPKGQDKYKCVDELHGLLLQKGIPMLDLSPGLADDLESVKRSFYRTDHHWRYEAAFSKFPEVARKIAALAGRHLPEDMPQFDIDNWRAISFENDFLGSQGRRTGAGFAGKDDFTYFTPKFKTDIDFCCFSKKTVHRHGPFHESIIDIAKTVSGLDPYAATRYHVYIGDGHYPISIKSELAPCKMRLMVIKDSYALPMLGYLSTVFSHIEVIDPRGYNGSVAEFAKEFRPDVMVTLVNMKSLSHIEVIEPYGHEDPIVEFVKYCNLDVMEMLAGMKWLSRTFFAFDPVDAEDCVASSTRLGTVQKMKSTSKYGFARAKCTLKPGVRYCLRTGPVELSGAGNLDVADVCLYDAASKKRIDVHSLRGGFHSASWHFAVPQDIQKPQLLFYAGRVGDCLGKSAVYRDVVLEELKGGR